MSQSSNEDFQTPATAPTRLFFSRFGETSLVVLGIFMLLGWVSGMAVRSVQRDEAIEPNVAFIFGLAIVALCVGVGSAGVIYGVLALFGLGNPRAKNDRLQGGIGAALCFLMTSGLVLAQFLVGAGLRARHDAQEQVRLTSESWPFVEAASGLTFHRPGPAWMLRTGAEAKSLNPLAIALTFDSSDAPGHERVVVILSEDLAGIDVAQMDLLALGQQLAEANGKGNRTVESVELLDVDGISAVRYVVSTDVAGVPARQFAVAVLRDDRCVQLLFAGEASDPDVSATEFALLLANVKFE